RERPLVGDARDAEVGDLDAAVGRDEQVSRLDVAVHKARGMGGLKGGCRLGDNVEHAVGREHALPLEDRRECLARHELHHEVGAAIFLAVVEDIRDALVVDEGGVPCLRAEALEEARVAQVFVLEDLDRDGATDDQVGRLPDLAHAAYGDTARQLVTTTEGEATRGSHLLSTASNTFLAIGAATWLPKPE